MSRRARLAAGALALSAVVVVLGRDLPGSFLVMEDPPGFTDAAVVMAGDLGFERTSAAAALVRSGQCRLVVVTGQGIGGDSALSLRERAVALGVPPERIRVEGTSRTTRESLMNVAPILTREGVHSVSLVTSPYHQRRATLAAREAWPDVLVRSRPASSELWRTRGWWRSPWARRVVASEYVKLAYYGLRGWI
jgi:uncharacterized SAM-binding protein YcdF (DUF218 family)